MWPHRSEDSSLQVSSYTILVTVILGVLVTFLLL